MTDVVLATPNRRRLRIALGVVFSLVVIGGAWFCGTTFRENQQRREDIAAIKKVRGRVYYPWEWHNGKRMPAARPPVPLWLIHYFGKEPFGRVVGIELENNEAGVNDDFMACVRRFDQLEYLSLFNSSVTEAGLEKLKNLTKLKSLWLQGSNVTGAGLLSLRDMVELEELTLPNFTVTDEQVAHLARLTKLKSLSIGGERFTDRGLSYIGGMKGLEELRLYKTSVSSLEPIRALTSLKKLDAPLSKIDDLGLAPIANFTNLEVLSLGGNPVTDAGMVYLRDLQKLQNLNLRGTRVSDAGLAQIRGLPLLLGLNLRDTKVTDAGILSLAEQGSLASCKVIFVDEIALAARAEISAKRPEITIRTLADLIAKSAKGK